MLLTSLLLSSLLLQDAHPASTAAAARPFALMVGDPAPALPVARWLKGTPVPRFEPGRVYVVEFWATWCGPCVRSMPHLSELQQRFADKVQVIGVDVWEPDLAAVEPFVQKQGERMAYSIAVDDVPAAPADCDNVSLWSAEHGAVSTAWMAASGWKEDGIPTAFVVDGKTRVAWIGGPQELDAPLAAIVDGSWDLTRESAAYLARQQITLRAQPLQARLRQAEQHRNWSEAVRCMDELMALDGPRFADLAGGKFQTLLLELKRPDEAYAFARAALTGVAKDEPSALGQIAYVIVFMNGEVVADELALARSAAERANELAHGERAGILDTLARVHFLSDEPERAVELEKAALAKSHDEGEKKELTQHLREYEKALGG